MADTEHYVRDDVRGYWKGDAGLLDLVIVAEEMGRLVTPGPLLPTNVVALAISERQKAPS